MFNPYQYVNAKNGSITSDSIISLNHFDNPMLYIGYFTLITPDYISYLLFKVIIVDEMNENKKILDLLIALHTEPSSGFYFG